MIRKGGEEMLVSEFLEKFCKRYFSRGHITLLGDVLNDIYTGSFNLTVVQIRNVFEDLLRDIRDRVPAVIEDLRLTEEVDEGEELTRETPFKQLFVLVYLRHLEVDDVFPVLEQLAGEPGRPHNGITPEQALRALQSFVKRKPEGGRDQCQEDSRGVCA